MKFVAEIVLSGCAAFAMPSGPQIGWVDANGKAVPSSDSRKSVKGFGGQLIVTSDLDWESKWNSPTPPKFTTVEKIKYGKPIFTLILFSNPQVGPDKKASLFCDIKVLRPDKSSSMDRKDVPCYGAVIEKPTNIYLSKENVGFRGDPGDLPGKWEVSVTIKDKLANVDVPLKTHFILEK